MKKILTLMALVLGGLTAMAQTRTIDLKTVLLKPVDGTVINCTDSFPAAWLVINGGPDPIYPTDTVGIADYENLFEQSGTEVSKSFFPVPMTDTFRAGDTLEIDGLTWNSHYQRIKTLVDTSTGEFVNTFVNGRGYFAYSNVLGVMKQSAGSWDNDPSVIDPNDTNNYSFRLIKMNCGTGIQDAINELVHPANGKPKTVLMIAHRLHTIVHANQIVVVEDGRVAATGTHEQLLASYEGYRKQWEAYTQLPANDSAFVSGIAASAAVPDVIAEAGPAAAGTPPQTPSAAQRQEDDAAADPYRHLGTLPAIQKSFVVAEDEKDRNRIKKAYWVTLLASPFISLAPIFVMLAVAGMFAGRTEDAWLYAGAMGLGFLVQGLLYYKENKLLFPFYPKLSSNIRLYLGKRLKNLPLGFFVGRETATLELRIKQDAMMAGLLPAFVGMLIKGTIAPAVTMIALLWIDWPLALVAAAGIPLSLLVTLLADRRFQEVMDRLQLARDRANSRIVDFIRGITVVRAFGLGRSSLIGYKDTMDEYRRSSIAINNRISPYSALNGIVFELGFVAVIAVGGWRYTDGSLDGLGFLCFMMLAAVLYEPLPMVDYMAYRRMMHMTVRNLNEIIQEEDLVQPKAGEERLPHGHNIELRGVRFGYDDSPVLKGVNLTIPAKGVTALVGPSGGGKTTTLNLIARLWDTNEGSVSIGGADVRGMRHDTLMSQVSIVFQDVYLFPDSIAANIRYGNPEATMEQVIAAAKAARCHDFITELPDGYETVVSEGGGTLSGGQRQRISIARAILKDAPIVLLDEATASIDPENERHIREALQALAANKTVVMVAHRLHTISQADLIAVMEDGRVVQTGKHEELLKQGGLYRTFWEERSRAERWQIQH